MVIFDEAHHAPSQYFSKALPIINSKITLGLSATPVRADKLEKILFWYFGDIIYKEERKEIKISIKIINFSIEHDKFKEIKLYNGELNRPLMINKLITIGRRNKMIINIITDILQDTNRYIIVLSDRVLHLELLKKRLDSFNITTTSFYIGGMKISDLKKSENSKVIFATYSMASEGLDIPHLNTLIMATSRRNIEQSVGRITRKISNVQPIVYDIVDELPCYISQSKFRKRFYIKNNYDIELETT
jgi:superfamily II DNA or RNA helicase